EAFASAPADLLVLALEAEAPLRIDLALESDQEGTTLWAEEQQRTLWATGTLGNGLRHATAVHLLEHDGPARVAAGGRGARPPDSRTRPAPATPHCAAHTSPISPPSPPA